MEEEIMNGLIRVVKGYSNISYILNDNSQFLLTEYKVIKNKRNSSFLKCSSFLYNGRIRLIYFSAPYISMLNMKDNIDGAALTNIIASILKEVISIENNGFLNCNNLDLTISNIYIEQARMNAKLVYLPVNSINNTSICEDTLRSNMIRFVNMCSNVHAKTKEYLCEILANTEITLSEIYDRITAGKNKAVSTNGKSKTSFRQMYLVAVNSPQYFEIKITKTEFIIGKKAEKTDAIINYNKAISRVHCKIMYDNGRYAITDLNSVNGTYVNGKKIKDNEIIQLKNGDRISLANSEFVVKIQQEG